MPNKEDDLYLVIGTEDGYFDKVDIEKYIKAKNRLDWGYYNIDNKAVTTYFNEKELFASLRESCHDLDWAPDELVVRPDFYRALESYSAYYDYTYYEKARNNPIQTYYGIKIRKDEKLDKPYKFMRGGKEV